MNVLVHRFSVRSPMASRQCELDVLSDATALTRCLLDLDDDTLVCILYHCGCDIALGALSCTCHQLLRAVTMTDDAWANAAARRHVWRCDPLSWRETLQILRRVDNELRRFETQPPPSSSHKLRCARDPASALSSTRPGSFSTAPDGPRSSSSRNVVIDIMPFSAREQAWVRWFGRFTQGVLHIDHAPHGRTILHLHDADTDDCIACALQSPSSGLHYLSCGACCTAGEDRLRHAVSEFRHRMNISRRVCVVDGSRPAGQAVIEKTLRRLPACVCRTVKAAGAEAAALHTAFYFEATAPPVVLVESNKPRPSIGYAMALVGGLVRQLVRHHVACGEVANKPADKLRGRVERVILVASTHTAADVFEKAVRSIVFKSHLTLPARVAVE